MNKPSAKAKKMLQIAVIAGNIREYHQITTAILYADDKLRRYVEFRLIRKAEDLRGKDWHGFVDIPSSGFTSGASDRRNAWQCCIDHKIQQWIIEERPNGPILKGSDGKQLMRS